MTNKGYCEYRVQTRRGWIELRNQTICLPVTSRRVYQWVQDNINNQTGPYRNLMRHSPLFANSCTVSGNSTQLSCNLMHSLSMTCNLMQAIAHSWACTDEVGSGLNSETPNTLTATPSLSNTSNFSCIILSVFPLVWSS